MNVALAVFCIVLGISVPIAAVVFIIIGRVRLARALKPVEFYPPHGYSPIDVWMRYYGINMTAHDLINPLMLYWADKGYITIEEDGKRGLKLTKLKTIDIPDDLYDMPEPQLRNFEIETALFDGLFNNRKVFYTLAADSSYNDDIKKFVTDCKSNAKEHRMTKRGKLVSRILAVLAVAVSVITTIIVGVSGIGPAALMMIFPIVGMVMFNFVPNEDIAGVLRYPFFLLWGGAPFGVALSTVPPICAVVLGIVIVSSVLTLNLLRKKIDLRSKENLRVYGEIQAFKTFLLHAELDRLETLVEDNPNYFYDILPYCYVLKITEIGRAHV